MGTSVRTDVVTVTVIGVAPATSTGLAEAKQVAPCGKPLQLKVTGCENPPSGEIVSEYVAGCPAEIVALGCGAEIVKSGLCWKPVPVSETI